MGLFGSLLRFSSLRIVFCIRLGVYAIQCLYCQVLEASECHEGSDFRGHYEEAKHRSNIKLALDQSSNTFIIKFCTPVILHVFSDPSVEIQSTLEPQLVTSRTPLLEGVIIHEAPSYHVFTVSL